MILSERPLLPTRYPDPNFLEALGLEASVRYLCHQLQWEEYSDAINVTYKHLTLEFLSSLTYEPYIGRVFKRGRINFRLYRNEYTFNHKDFANLLGFQYGLNAMHELPVGDFMQDEFDKFWSDISDGRGPDPSSQLSNRIHNPAFRYFQMILARTFFGKSETDDHVSAEEIFMLFCTTLSRLIASVNFLINNLNLTSRSPEGPIYVGGTVTRIAYALGLFSKLSHLTDHCGYTLIDLDHCLDCGLMRGVYFSHAYYKLLIDN